MNSSGNKYKVVIVGGGFGGLWTATHLKDPELEITLIDKRNFHLFQPLLYQVATGGLSPADIASPLRGILAKRKNVQAKLAEMTGIDKANKKIILKDGEVAYDSLVIATGSENFYFGNDSWSEFAPGLKTIEDAINIRNRIYTAFEKAEKETDSELRRQFLTFVIVGGGPTGVELAGALGEITKLTLKGNFRSIDPNETRIVIVEGSPNILESFPDKLQQAAINSLNQLGVEVLTGAYARNIDNLGVLIEKEDKSFTIASKTVLWAAGVKASPVGSMLTDKDKYLFHGKIVVDQFMNLPDHQNIYVIGDLAHVVDEDNKPLPGTAPVAMSQGRYVARTITNRLKNKPVKKYNYFNKGNMAVIGRAAAIADLGWSRFSGYPAWLLWLFIHLMYLVEYDNRLIVFIQWAWNYFTRNKGARLITFDQELANKK